MSYKDEQLNELRLSSGNEYFADMSPDSLLGYKLKNPLEMGPSTRTNYSAKWGDFIKSRNEERFCLKIHGLIFWVISEYETGNHKVSTFRYYRAVCYFGLSTLIDDEGFLKSQFSESHVSEKFYENLYSALREFKVSKTDIGVNDKLIVPHTSAKKKKDFPKPIVEWLLNFNATNMPIVRLLQKFIQANLLIGLRPSEWLNVREACSMTKKTVLVVDNAKDSQGRANGHTRTLILENISLEEKRIIREFKEAFHQFLEESYQQFKSKCQAYYDKDPRDKTGKRALGHHHLDLHYGEGLCWNPIIPSIPLEELAQFNSDDSHVLQPEFARIQLVRLQNALVRILSECPLMDCNDQTRPTLYSTRHQCIADAKHSKMNVFEMAAFFGHASVKTAREHYGKAGSGWRVFKFIPDPESVALVRQPRVVSNLIEPTPAPMPLDDFDYSGW